MCYIRGNFCNKPWNKFSQYVSCKKKRVKIINRSNYSRVINKESRYHMRVSLPRMEKIFFSVGFMSNDILHAFVFYENDSMYLFIFVVYLLRRYCNYYMMVYNVIFLKHKMLMKLITVCIKRFHWHKNENLHERHDMNVLCAYFKIEYLVQFVFIDTLWHMSL